MSKQATAQSHIEAVHRSRLARELRTFIDNRHPGISNQQFYEAVVDVYAHVVRDNNRASVEQVQSALSAVYRSEPPLREVETEKPERQQEMEIGM